jgi:hypothetical protein
MVRPAAPMGSGLWGFCFWGSNDLRCNEALKKDRDRCHTLCCDSTPNNCARCRARQSLSSAVTPAAIASLRGRHTSSARPVGWCRSSVHRCRLRRLLACASLSAQVGRCLKLSRQNLRYRTKGRRRAPFALNRKPQPLAAGAKFDHFQTRLFRPNAQRESMREGPPRCNERLVRRRD